MCAGTNQELEIERFTRYSLLGNYKPVAVYHLERFTPPTI